MARPYYVFEVKDATGVAERHELSDEVTVIGRSQRRAQVVVNDAKASGQHCELRFQGGRIMVHDLNSTNGTFVDGRRAQQPFPLAVGGTFKVGDSTLRLVSVTGLEEEAPRRPVYDEPPSDESTRALSMEDLEQLRGADLPSVPLRADPPLAATQALDMESHSPPPDLHRPGNQSPRRPDPGELRARQAEEARQAEAEAARRAAEFERRAEEARARKPVASFAPDPRSLDGRLQNAPADRTMAFDRAEVEIGGYDNSWQAPGEAEPQADPADWVSSSARSTSSQDEEPSGRRGPSGLVRTLAVVTALYAGGMGAFITIRPGSSADIDIPTVDMSADPAVMIAQTAATTATASRALIDGQYRFASLLGGEIYTIMDGHQKDLAAKLETLKGADKRTLEETVALTTEITDKVTAFSATSGLCLDKLASEQRSLWYSFGAAFAVSASIIGGLAGAMGAFAGLGLVVAAVVPLVLTQPAPYEPLFFTGIFALLGVWIFVLQWKGRRG